MARLLKAGESQKLLLEGDNSYSTLQFVINNVLQDTIGMTDSIYLKILREYSKSGITNHLEATVAWMLLFSLRVVRHESAHLAALLVLGDKQTYILKSLILQSLEVEMPIVVNELRLSIPFISSGEVTAEFLELREAAYSALICINAPKKYDLFFRFSYDSIDYVEGGMSVEDEERSLQVRLQIKEEGFSGLNIYQKVLEDLKHEDPRVSAYVDLLSSQIFSRAMKGERTFDASQLYQIVE